MKITIRSKLKDFIVQELVNLPMAVKGPYAVYALTKEHRNTVDVILELSQKLNVPFEHFSYGGRKDRHALTTQYIAVRHPKFEEIKEKDYSLRFFCFMDRPMGPDLIAGNQFEITVRKLTDAQSAQAVLEVEPIQNFGYINYFDDQRFGSFDPLAGFFAEKIILGHLGGALKIYLTMPKGADRKDEIERKFEIAKYWRDWDKCKHLARTEFEQKSFAFLMKHPNAFLFLLKQIPREMLSLYFSAYQSYLWNEVARRLLFSHFPSALKIYQGSAGDYYFYSELLGHEQQYFSYLLIPTLASKIKMPDQDIGRIYNYLLQERGITCSRINKIKLREVYFKSTDRLVVMKPKNLTCQIAEDECNPKYKKLILKFNLPRGSYGTMLLKRLFSAERLY